MGDGVVMDIRGYEGRQIKVGRIVVRGEVQGVFDFKNVVFGNFDLYYYCVGYEGFDYGFLQRIRSL